MPVLQGVGFGPDMTEGYSIRFEPDFRTGPSNRALLTGLDEVVCRSLWWRFRTYVWRADGSAGDYEAIRVTMSCPVFDEELKEKPILRFKANRLLTPSESVFVGFHGALPPQPIEGASAAAGSGA